VTGRVTGEVWPAICGALWSLVVVVVARRSRPPRRLRALAAESPRRLASSGADGHRPPATRLLVLGASATASRFGRGLRRVLGRPDDPALDRRVGAAATVALVAALASPWLGVVLGVAAWLTPWAVAQRAQRRQRDRVLDELPDVVDLLRLALGAGYSLRLALLAVADRTTGTFGDAMHRLRGRLERGQGLGDALGELESLGQPAAPLVSGLRASEQLGAPLLPLLVRLSDDARGARRRRAEERARRVPVKLLFPLVFCTLPAFGLLTVVPLLASALGHLSF
jgi:tight adherence protein C